MMLSKHVDELSITSAESIGGGYSPGYSQEMLGEMITRASVNLVDFGETSELNIELYDPLAERLLTDEIFGLDALVVWTPTGGSPQRFLVTRRDIVDQHRTRITCRTWASTVLKRTYGPLASPATSTMVEALRTFTAELNPRIAIKSQPETATSSNWTVEPGAGTQKPENIFNAVERWSDEEFNGYVFTEVGATSDFLFGMPSWMAANVPMISVLRAEFDEGVIDVTGGETLDANGESLTLIMNPPIQRDFTITVPIEVGKTLLPCRMARLTGYGKVDGEYWISEVSGDLEEGAVWTIRLITPRLDKQYFVDYGDTTNADSTINPNAKNLGGSISWRNNNPGNIRPGQFATEHGAIGQAGGFAVFPSYAVGRAALIALLKGPVYRNLTLLQAMEKYAPYGDGNNPALYAATLAKKLGIPVSTVLNTFTDAQFEALADAIQNFEGWTVGTTVSAPTAGSPTGTTKTPIITPKGDDGAQYDSGDLVSKILAHPKITFSGAYTKDLYGITTLGKVYHPTQRLLKFMLWLASKHAYNVSCIGSEHSLYVNGTKSVSQHRYGGAIDINFIDGRHLVSTPASMWDQWAAEMAAAPADARPIRLGMTHRSGFSSGSVIVFHNTDHDNHFHVGCLT